MDRSTRHHTAEALKAQIWFLVVWNALMLPLILTNGDGAEPPVWVWFGPLLEFLAGVSTVGLAIRGAVQASRGNWWRYPLPFRVVPGSLPKRTTHRVVVSVLAVGSSHTHTPKITGSG
jgi:hypothetical protein